MKALSLLQPWATLVVTGIKKIETRSWNTSYRGRLLIHASKGRSGETFSSDAIFKKHLPSFDLLPFGAVIGSVNLTEVVPINTLNYNDVLLDKLTMEEKAFGDYTEGRYAWILEQPLMFKKPIAFRGMISLWEFPDNLLIESSIY